MAIRDKADGRTSALNEGTAPRRKARSGQIVDLMRPPTFRSGDRSMSLLARLDLLAAVGVGAAHLCTLVLGKPDAVIRRLGRIQSEQPGRNTLSVSRCDRRCRHEGDEGQCAECDARKADGFDSGVLEEFRHGDLFLSVEAQLKVRPDRG